jgi:uncharacterized protein (TIGR00730 family)
MEGVTSISSICIFCGSSAGTDPAYAEAARAVGAGLAERGLRLVYGGGRVGLMGAVAEGAIEAGGDVVGVIPEQLVALEAAHPRLGDDLRVVESMHERKALMAELADAFIALPGGIGTFEELFEIFTWAHLGLHAKPLGLLDVAGYYGPLTALLDHAVTTGFLRPDTRAMLVTEDSLDALLERFEEWEPAGRPVWLDRDAT